MVVPLILASGFIYVLGPSTSNWVFLSNLWSSSVPASSSSSASPPVSPVKGSEKRLDLRSPVVVVEVHNMKEAISDESLLNRSSIPSTRYRSYTRTTFQQNVTEEDVSYVSTSGPVYNASTSGPSFLPPLNESHAPRMKAGPGYSNLGRLEAGLRRARAAIKEAKHANQTQDPDYYPVGPMYRNANAVSQVPSPSRILMPHYEPCKNINLVLLTNPATLLCNRHRSYLEMEKKFKIFVYEEGEPPLFHNGPCRSIYSTEGNFIHGIEMNSQFRTRDPEKAHMFFLPFSVTMLVRFVYVRDSHDFGPIKRTVTDYVNVIAGKYPYWNRSLAADHFMLSCHDWVSARRAPGCLFPDFRVQKASRSTPYLHKNSIRVLCNANTSEGFKPAKDVSFPEINLQTGTIHGFIGGPSPSRRPVLAFFAGGLHGPIRPVLLEHWENKDEDIRVHRYLPKGISYYGMMKKSKYCICPSGYEVASPRVVEAIYVGCVPVLISEHYVPPFSDVLNWKSFCVEVPVEDVPNLKKILMDISPRQYIRMQKRVVQVRRHFEVQSPPKRFDAFHMILHSIWLRRLNVQVHNDINLS
ncbi:hypothetical protein CJ030_MR2G020379 [Morella rubra]|uniref:Exostosin GT47 domain-containing protein n=1 Tax=Morella rubra TaxID=262757 RepID=A0A6A1W8K0_9ROSI|nr:hypothetical protein CJ030_MR2G020379 [Morella rubra]